MEFESLLHTRRSIRFFQGKPVEPEKVQAILEAAGAAPSAGNRQAYRIVHVTQQARRDELAEACLGQKFVAQAPVVLVFLADPLRSAGRYGQRGKELYALQDATIACAHAHLRAADLGLGSVWVGAFDDAAVAAAVGSRESLRPVAVLPIGYPGETPKPRPRRGIGDIVSREHI